jgi:hypothetical protein
MERLPQKPPLDYVEPSATGSAEPLGRDARDARVLADLYCRVAYAPGTLPRSSLRPLEAFWRNLFEVVAR